MSSVQEPRCATSATRGTALGDREQPATSRHVMTSRRRTARTSVALELMGFLERNEEVVRAGALSSLLSSPVCGYRPRARRGCGGGSEWAVKR